jgi:hypothetical protein
MSAANDLSRASGEGGHHPRLGKSAGIKIIAPAGIERPDRELTLFEIGGQHWGAFPSVFPRVSLLGG